MRLHWTPEAKAQLVAIRDTIAAESPAAAKRVVVRLLERCSQLVDLPRSGRRVEDYGRDDIRQLLIRPYRVVYRIKPDQIDILTVKHYRRLLPHDWQQLDKD